MNYLGLFFAIAGGVLSAFLAGVGSAKGVGMVGEAAAAVIREDSSKFGKMVFLILLPGSQGLYGLVITILLFSRIGLLGGSPMALTLEQGLMYFAACLPMAIVGLFSRNLSGQGLRRRRQHSCQES